MFVIGHGTNFNKFVTTYANPSKKASNWYKEYGEQTVTKTKKRMFSKDKKEVTEVKKMKLMNGECVDVSLKLVNGKVQIEKIKNIFMVPQNMQMEKYYRL